MPRKPRIHFPGAVYHVMLRGNGGQNIFTDDFDRSRFLLILQQERELSNCRIHAFCLMDTHVHLALQVAHTPLSKIMQKVGYRYTQYFNRKLKQWGHLFQGRFKAILVDQNRYLLELVRYIHLNPIRANLFENPDHYCWSSHHCYREDIDIPWLTTDWVLAQFNANQARAKELYRAFIRDGFADGYKQEFHRGSFEGRALGDDRFIEQALASAEQRYIRPVTVDAILDAVCACYDMDLAELIVPGRRQPFAEARGVAALLVRQFDVVTIAELGLRLGRKMTGLSHAASRIEKRSQCDEALKGRLQQAEELLDKYVSHA